MAKIARLPSPVIKRAEEMMAHFEGTEIKVEVNQMSFSFVEKENPLKNYLEEVNPNNLTPLKALEILYKLKKMSEE